MIWVISFSGILVFAGLNTLLKCHVVPRVLRGKEAHLSEKEGISRVPGYEESIVSQRLLSLLTASGVSAIGLLVVWETRSDVMAARSPLIVPAAFFFMAYFTVDLYSMYQVYRLKNVEHLRRSLGQNLRGCICNKAIFVIHHVLIIVFGPVFAQYSLRRGLGDFYIGCFLCFETSTIFLSLHYILTQIGKRDSLTFQINGILFLASYFVFRVLIFPFMYLIYAYQYHQGNLLVAMEAMPWVCHGFCAVGYVMQFYWFIEAVMMIAKTANRLYLKRRNQL